MGGDSPTAAQTATAAGFRIVDVSSQVVHGRSFRGEPLTPQLFCWLQCTPTSILPALRAHRILQSQHVVSVVASLALTCYSKRVILCARIVGLAISADPPRRQSGTNRCCSAAAHRQSWARI